MIWSFDNNVDDDVDDVDDVDDDDDEFNWILSIESYINWWNIFKILVSFDWLIGLTNFYEEFLKESFVKMKNIIFSFFFFLFDDFVVVVDDDLCPKNLCPWNVKKRKKKG